MATIRVCDNCGKQAAIKAADDLGPKEWYNLRTMNFQKQTQLCSLDCVIAHADGLRLGEQQEAAKEIACENLTSSNIV